MRSRASDGATTDVSREPSTSGGDGRDASLGFWQLLSGKEIKRPTHPAKGDVRARVVLLHGWLMNHACWLNTATQLRDRYGHDVLLLDFPGHGRSPLLPKFTDHTPEAFMRRLRAVLTRVGWTSADDQSGNDPSGTDPSGNEPSGDASGSSREVRNTERDDRANRMRVSKEPPPPPLVLCGLSLGGVVCCLYAIAYPREVSRVVLVSSPGLDEKWYSPANLTRPFRGMVLSTANAFDRGYVLGGVGRWLVSRRFHPAHAFLSHVRLVRDTPTFGAPSDAPLRLKRLGIPTVLVWGALDQLHTAQIRRWKAGRPHARDVAEKGPPPDGDRGVHILIHPWFDHLAACLFLDVLRLGERAHFWHDTVTDAPRVNEVRLRSTETEPTTRARL